MQITIGKRVTTPVPGRAEHYCAEPVNDWRLCNIRRTDPNRECRNAHNHSNPLTYTG